jgi:uncharacterized membrane protein HdeD (DUF308 family)
MNKKQFFYLMGGMIIFSVLTGLLSLFYEDAEWSGALLAMGSAIIFGALVIIAGLIKIIQQITDKRADPEKRKWLVKRLVAIILAGIIIFTVSYFRTPH